MWKYLSTFLFVLICIGLEAAIQDQCGKGRCKLTSLKHVTCDTTAHFLPTCPPDAKVVDLSYDDVDQILDLHNKYRNKIASGQEAGFEPAAKMPTILWNQDLADYAELNVRRCKYAYDCHNDPEFSYSGQNLCQSSGSQYRNVTVFIEESIDSFYNGKQHATQADIDKCCGSEKSTPFLLMNLDKTNQIGCAMLHYPTSAGKTSYLVCNYSYQLFSGAKVYESGKPTSKCKSGANEKFPALCSSNERIDPNTLP